MSDDTLNKITQTHKSRIKDAVRCTRYGTVNTNFKPKLQYVGLVRFYEYVAVCYVGTVWLISQGTGMWYARF